MHHMIPGSELALMEVFMLEWDILITLSSKPYRLYYNLPRRFFGGMSYDCTQL